MSNNDPIQASTVAEAVEILTAQLGQPDRTEVIQIEDSVGRVLASPAEAALEQPHYPRSNRDGYAVRSEDIPDTASTRPTTLTETNPPVETGETSYVHTGSAVPTGADAVVMIEDVTETETGIEVREPVESGDFVTEPGAELAAGTRLFEPGHRLRPGDLGTLKVADVSEVSVRQKPTVAVVPTGEELVQSDPAPGEVIETNGLVGNALVEQWGGDPRYRSVVTDDEAALRAAIERDQDAGLLVTSGGSSVGSRDLLPAVVADMGTVLVDGLALRPGHSASVGVVSGTPVVMAPGTPIASLVVARLLVRPAIAAALGTALLPSPTTEASLAAPLDSVAGKHTVHGIRLESTSGADDSPVAHEAARGGLPSLARIDGWVQVEESRATIDAGESVAVERWGECDG